MHNSDIMRAHRSFDVPLMKVITQGRTLTPSRSTNQGTFSTKTRMKSVPKYFDASRCRCLSMISQRLNLWWKKWITQRGSCLHTELSFSPAMVGRG